MSVGRQRRIATAIERGVARITLQRPDVDLALAQELTDAADAIANEDAVRVVVLDAGGRDFSRGLPRDASPPPTWPDAVAAVARLPQPVLAAIDGEARGLGFALALACDLRIATTRATFTVPARGGFPAGGLTQRLPRLVGAGRAMSLVLLGESLAARDALAWGLVSELVAPPALPRVVAERAAALAGRAPIALRYAKEAVTRALDLPLADGVRLEHDLYVLLQTTADRREGIAAFLARHTPRFSGNGERRKTR